jgi:hypothetical protein
MRSTCRSNFLCSGKSVTNYSRRKGTRPSFQRRFSETSNGPGCGVFAARPGEPAWRRRMGIRRRSEPPARCSRLVPRKSSPRRRRRDLEHRCALLRWHPRPDGSFIDSNRASTRPRRRRAPGRVAGVRAPIAAGMSPQGAARIRSICRRSPMPPIAPPRCRSSMRRPATVLCHPMRPWLSDF